MPNEWTRRVDEHFGAPPSPPAAPYTAPIDLDGQRERKYALGALAGEVANMAGTTTGRNHQLNTSAYKLAGYVTTGALGESEVIDALTDAARSASAAGDHPLTEAEIAATLRSALGAARAKGLTNAAPEDDDDVVTEVGPGTLKGSITAIDRNGHTVPIVDTAMGEIRRIMLTTLNDIASAAPIWVWEYGGHGRIQLGTLCLMAGRPGAGKSNAARWFAAGFSNGTVDGCFYGHPVNVAYISPAEESHAYVIKPGLIAAGADPARIYFPDVVDDTGEPTRLLSALHEVELTKVFLESAVRVVIVDPVMSTIPGQVDVNRNNETRAYVEPWARIAGNIDGVVLGVAHLVKHPGSDLVAAINGSSAFGEVARSIFGFVKDRASGDRVMSQVKNSAGFEDLSLTYAITSAEVPVDSGEIAEVAAFAITGLSTLDAAELLDADRDTEAVVGRRDIAQLWLQDYLESEGRARPVKIIAAGKDEGHARSTLYRAAKKIGVEVDYEGMPRIAWWRLPVSFYENLRGTTGSAGHP